MNRNAARLRKTMLRAAYGFLILTLVTGIAEIFPTRTAYAAPSYLLSLDRAAYASSTEGNNTPDLAVDGNSGSRWSSAWGSDPQWIYVDLGAAATIDRVVLNWEGAYAKAYKIQVSNDEASWTDVYSTAAGDGGVDTIPLAGSGRYVRLLCTERFLPQYGVSVFEFEIYGTGGINPPPVALGPNVALNRPVTASSYEQSGYLPPGSTLPRNAVDGNSSTRWSSNPTDGEWIYVDLGSVRSIGRVRIQWEAAAGRAYDVQVSTNASDWTTVYREMTGDGGLKDIQLYANARYVRMKGISRATGFGYSIFEFAVYDYVPGDPQPNHPIPPLPTPSTVQVGQGSYYTNDIAMPQPKYPLYKGSNITGPLPSNDWWQSVFINRLGNGIITLPLKSKYTKQGLSVLNPGAGWVNGRSQEASGSPDLFLMASNINTSSMSNKIVGYGDWSATVSLSDNAADKMKTTFVKGSPYLFNEFSDPNSAELYFPASVRFFNDANGTILAADGASVAGDHIGFTVTNTDGAPTPATVTRHYGIFAPPGTTFKRVGAKIKMQLGGGQNYVSLSSLPAVGDLNYYYQHAYAFVTNTTVTPSYNPATSEVTTNFSATVSQKRSGFPATTLMALLPHQWKITTSPLTSLSYASIRGTMKVREGNSFATVDRFHGIVPQFTEPNDPSYSRQTLLQYLALLEQDTATNPMRADAYWQGKVLHPLAMGVLIADQIGAADYKATFLARMKTVLSDWYTYTQGEPDYFLYYDPVWGTMYYKASEFGANTGITDHHFTYGYYVFASAVLATYDQDFRDKFSPMIDHLIRDYANPSKTDPMYPFLRNFDPYEGHSWAGGYADNDSGNNQEAAGESLFGWVGQYLWSVLTGNTAYRDTAIYGFTTELKAVEQYWFNYDNDNWHPAYPYKTAGQVYGSSNFFGTFFNGDPVYVYGIHWLPTAEYLTSYGFDTAKVAALYNGFVADNGGPETDWYHIVWPIQALSNPQAVLAKWSTAGMQQNEAFNTYWFVHSMASLGQRTKDIWATGGYSATVYKNGATYSALVWNPTNAPITVTFRNGAGATGTATVAAKTLAKVNPTGSNPGLQTPPSLTADATQNTVGQPIGLTFADNAAWRGAISGVRVNGAALPSGQYAISAGQLTLNAGVFPQAGTYSVTVQANGYNDASVSQAVLPSGGTGNPGSANLALGKPAASSAGPLQGAALAVDGNAGSRWESAFSDPQWIQIDLEATAVVERFVLNWEGAYGRAYAIEVSADGNAWSTVYSTTTGDGGVDDIPIAPVGARYVRLTGTQRGTPYGYSLWEFEIHGTSSAPINLARNKTVATSANPITAGAWAVDGNPGTRWESAFSDPQWISVDLGAAQSVGRVYLNWEGAYASSYAIEVSTDGNAWSPVYSTATGDGGIDEITFSPVNARYVRLTGTQRGTPYGYSLWELEVYSH